MYNLCDCRGVMVDGTLSRAVVAIDTARMMLLWSTRGLSKAQQARTARSLELLDVLPGAHPRLRARMHGG